MKRLDQFIDSHIDELDNLEPAEGHFIRFQNKLNHSKEYPLSWFLKYAAVLFIAVFISINLFVHKSGNTANLSPELQETAYYYNLRSENLVHEIKQNKVSNSAEIKVIMQDIREIDQEYNKILKDLSKFPDDERIVNAFIDYHRSKSEFLEGILNQINSQNLTNI